jgi:hypothetical protein
VNPIKALARTAAQAAWAEHKGQAARVPRYPALPAWMALAARLKQDGQADRLNGDAQGVPERVPGGVGRADGRCALNCA